jgi:tetratricopeptide (TPR) repeat protein
MYTIPMISKKSTPIQGILSCLFILIVHYQLNSRIERPILSPSLQESALNFNEQLVQIFSVGQKRLLSSLLWVHTLMISDTEHYDGESLRSWMFLRFNLITKLDPRFYEAYLYGGLYLSVVKDDTEGAKVLYEKGLKIYPEDFWLRFYNGYNYYYEIGDHAKAIENFEIAANHPEVHLRVAFLPSLLARLKAEEFDAQAAFDLLYPIYNSSAIEGNIREHQERILYALRAEIDLDCLNSQQLHCNRIDFRGDRYVRGHDGVYSAQHEWTKIRPYRMRNRAENQTD